MTEPLTMQQIAEIKAKALANESWPQAAQRREELLSLIATIEARAAAFDMMLEALKGIVETYKNNNPRRIAGNHIPECRCMRCRIDNAETTIAIAAAQAVKGGE
jgi:NADH:ubiquinone oxidoreductase subunit E